MLTLDKDHAHVLIEAAQLDEPRTPSMKGSNTRNVFIQATNADDVRLAELGYKGEFKREFSVGVI